ncbi:hypothetical protein EO98_08695 [Methanosarcina sp. 2.H.T.1A.6]|uniref:DUF1015 domain-containing protein n=1 Tax=unclassified Methanosarcina TaxID=2644672 RepID=UPI0006217856|nr:MULTISPECIES: DUF1015 domain-containing protein [unclassified Methanosarcina]KKG17259.1 hypothetical protein EO94_13075 [Methanosarcina sp. 2.H.T.1A.3]KKG24100.1 hypothetical protein EO98_08695 [Methanosarcina sp. 2.H.T.1A.6]KKG26566.1 hypothetical protein EO96_13795 [Methanosarcina sp. 2.H.T.1A.8]KKG27465.1 hypothetical protein EO97_02930 [Methanosarcina sp. 2.H.T.1A.15]
MILHVPHILLPEANWSEWAVIACDQHTQDIEYWRRVEEFVGDTPSTLNLIYPEIYLPLDKNRVNNIHKAMRNYKATLVDHGPCFVLVKRAVSGSERTGLVVAIDLEEYEYDGSESFIRPTEKTIKERLPARVMIRENAELELTHVLVLYDDPNFSVIPLNTDSPVYEGNQIYDFDLMEDGGHIRGFKISDEKTIREISERIQALGTLLVGDGNHSLAAAKSLWEKIKGTVPDNHPARYALVELVNIHDPGLTFEPIHRVVRGVDPEELLKRFNARIMETPSGNSTASSSVTGNLIAGDLVTGNSVSNNPATDNLVAGHSIGFITKDRRGVLIFDNPEHDLEVETLDEVIDDYPVEYEHDPEVVEKLGKEPENIGFFLPSFKRSDFFALIKKKGILPRKSFSLGKENEKRYYIEARRIMQ